MKSFERCHPSVNFMYYISAVVFGVIFLHPVLLGVSFCTSLTYSIKLTGKKAVKTLFCFLLPLIIIAAVINGFTAHYGVTVLGTLPDGNKLCLEPIVFGLVTGTAASVVILLFSSYNKTVTSDKLFYALGKKFPKITLLLTMSLRFVPLYRQRFAEISAVQSTLGRGTDSGNIIERIRNGGKIISVLITWSLENSIETADSMKSRGYALKNRTHYSSYRFSPFDVAVMIFLLLCDAVIIAGAAMGETYVLYNPFFEIKEISGFSFFLYIVYALLFLTPVIIDFMEDMKWKISR